MSLVKVFADTYVDSVLLLGASRAMLQSGPVRFATAVMATAANIDDLRGAGIDAPVLGSASANDLLLAVDAADDQACAAAITAGEEALFARRRVRPSVGTTADEPSARTLDQARSRLAGANIAVVSVPGPYAAMEAHKAISAGLDVLLFSDNVSVDDEIELKDRALMHDRLVMGPGAGTAVLGGCGLGFANVVSPGRVGVVAAAGTGAQEVMSLLDQWGEGVSQVIGVGGRDLSRDVGGRMARAAVRALDADPATDVILLVSKPPAEAVARAVIAEAEATPVVAALIGHADTAFDVGPRHRVVTTLEAGAAATLRCLGGEPPDLVDRLTVEVEKAVERLDPSRSAIRGLFSGGTLCYEALSLLGRTVGPVYSNTPLDPSLALPAPAGSHVCLDLGDEDFTKGRPHPMIDPDARVELLEEAVADDCVAVILVDVVLGMSAHADPAAAIEPVCRRSAANGGPVVVAYVLGTTGDPQGLEDQRHRLSAAGCIVGPTAARASLAAAALCRRDPSLVAIDVP